MTIIVIAVSVNIFLSLLVANMGSERRLGNVKSFLLSFLFSPILGMLFVIASERLTAEEIKKREENSVAWGRISLVVGLVLFMVITTVLMLNS